MGRAQKLKQQRKEEEVKRRQQERRKIWKTTLIVVVSLLTVAVTIGLIMLVNQLKKGESGPKITQELVLDTSKGEIVIGLFGEDTPVTVQHIDDLVGRGYYDGLRWYRVEDFVVQTGSHYFSLLAESGEAEPDQAQLEQAMTEDQGIGTVVDEIKFSNTRGRVGMAKPSDPDTQVPQSNSATTDFYILKSDATNLDLYFTIFGEVVKGMDVVDSLEDTDVIISATIREK